VGQVTCSYSISPTSQLIGKNGGFGNVNVTSQFGCYWTAVSNVNWIGVIAGSSGSGNGTVTYGVKPNYNVDSRVGTLTIAGQTVTVYQNGANAYTLTASPSAVVSGSTLTVNWTAPIGSSPKDWIGLYKVGAPSTNTNLISWQYTQGAQSGSRSFIAPAQPGQYEFRYFLNDGYTQVARSNAVAVMP
jgi:hypothetical protein